MAVLIAYMNGERVGEFTKLSNGAHQFQYDKSWIESTVGRPLSLSLPLQYPKITSDCVINSTTYYLIYQKSEIALLPDTKLNLVKRSIYFMKLEKTASVPFLY